MEKSAGIAMAAFKRPAALTFNSSADTPPLFDFAMDGAVSHRASRPAVGELDHEVKGNCAWKDKERFFLAADTGGERQQVLLRVHAP